MAPVLFSVLLWSFMTRQGFCLVRFFGPILPKRIRDFDPHGEPCVLCLPSPWPCSLEKEVSTCPSSSGQETDNLAPSHHASECLLMGHLAELTCTVSMTMEKEWSSQSWASRYWQTPLKVKYLSSKLLKWDCPVMRHSPAGAQRKEEE